MAPIEEEIKPDDKESKAKSTSPSRMPGDKSKTINKKPIIEERKEDNSLNFAPKGNQKVEDKGDSPALTLSPTNVSKKEVNLVKAADVKPEDNKMQMSLGLGVMTSNVDKKGNVTALNQSSNVDHERFQPSPNRPNRKIRRDY